MRLHAIDQALLLKGDAIRIGVGDSVHHFANTIGRDFVVIVYLPGVLAVRHIVEGLPFLSDSHLLIIAQRNDFYFIVQVLKVDQVMQVGYQVVELFPPLDDCRN